MESRGTVIIMVLLGGLALAAVGVGVMTAKPQIALILLAAVAMGLLFVLVLRMVRARRARWRTAESREPQATGASLGLMPIPKPGKELLKHFADIGAIARNGSIKHAMHGMLGPRRLMLFQHTYHVHTGQASIPIVSTLLATTSPHWPELRLTPRGFWSNLLLRFGYGRGVPVESAVFNRNFKVTCADEDFAITLLSLEMQAFILLDAEARWIISGGEVCMLSRGALRPDRMSSLLDRVRAFWALVPPELEEWETR